MSGVEKLDMTLDQLAEDRPSRGRGLRGRGGRGSTKRGGGMIVFGSKASNDASSGRGSWPKRRAAPQSSWGVRKVVRGSRGGGRSWRRGASGWSSQVPGEFAKRSLGMVNPPYNDQKKLEAMEEEKWQHDMFDDREIMPPRRSNVFPKKQQGLAKLLISNLEFNVTDEDLHELFSSVGTVRQAGIHYDRSDRSKGTAVVVYERLQDAEEAIKKFNNVCLDGKPLVIQMEESKSHITTLSSGINVTEPKADKVPEVGVGGKTTSHASTPSMPVNRSRLKSSIVKSGLYADRMEMD